MKKRVPHRGRRGKHAPKREREYDRPDRRNSGGNNHLSRRIGLILAGIEAVISVVFLVALFQLNMFPALFMAIIAIILVVFLQEKCDWRKSTECNHSSIIIARFLLSVPGEQCDWADFRRRV